MIGPNVSFCKTFLSLTHLENIFVKSVDAQGPKIMCQQTLLSLLASEQLIADQDLWKKVCYGLVCSVEKVII